MSTNVDACILGSSSAKTSSFGHQSLPTPSPEKSWIHPDPIAHKFTIQSLYLTMFTDDRLRICSPWLDAHHCSCSLEEGTLLPLLQSAE